jgi:hypothetical protein
VFERIRAAYLTYIQRIEFQVLVILVFTLWIFLNIFITAFSNWHISYLTLAVPGIVIYSSLTGEQLKRQLASYRSHLVPNYRAPHFWTALGLSLIFGFVMCIPLAQATPAGFKGIEGIAVFLWSMGLLAFCAGYFLRPLFIFTFFSLWFITERIKASGFFLSVIASQNPAMTLVLIVNSVVSILLVWRMTRLHEGMFEYRWMEAMDNPLVQRTHEPEGRSFGRTIYQKLFQPSERALNRIQWPMRRDLLAQMRHFQLSLEMSQPAPTWIFSWIGIMWVVNFITGTDTNAGWLSSIMILPTFTLFASTGGFQRNTLEWVGMLPLSRKELITKVGGAMVWSVLRWWACFAVAVYFVSWMPFPGVIRGLPPLLPFAASLSLQLPMFAIATLTAMKHKAIARGLAVGGVIALSGFFIAFASTPSRAALMIAATILLGAALTWASYRHWRAADID